LIEKNAMINRIYEAEKLIPNQQSYLQLK
jgi:hypothetical protein